MKFYYINTERYKGIINQNILVYLKENTDVIKFKELDNFNDALSEYLKLDSDEEIENILPLENKPKQISNSKLSNSKVTVWTDGGSRITGNTKGNHVNASDESAWAYKIDNDGENIVDTGSEFGATNNKMELTAVNSALLKLYELGLQDADITIISDSMYVINTATKWAKKWKSNGWNKKGGIKNLELVKSIEELTHDFNNLKFKWVKGHTEGLDKDHKGNVTVDKILNSSMDAQKGRVDRPASEKQKNYIKSLGGDYHDNITMKEASIMIGKLLKK